MYLVPIDLFSRSSEKLLDSVARLGSAELVALAGRLTRIFSIASPFAPGLHCVGGEIAIDADPIAASGATRLSVAGNGETLATALVSRVWVKRPIFFRSSRDRATSRQR